MTGKKFYKNEREIRRTEAGKKRASRCHVRGGEVACALLDVACGRCVIVTLRTATNPSIAFCPFTATVPAWLIPLLVFCKSPETYLTLV
jgi:hypothetical protein